MIISSVFVLAVVSVLDTSVGVPVSKAAARFPAIAKMTAKSHPMLASVFASADTAAWQQQPALKEKQELIGPVKEIGPGGPGQLPDATSIVEIVADLHCKLCQKNNDIECIKKHCWNDGFGFAFKSNTPVSVNIPFNDNKNVDTFGLPRTFSDIMQMDQFKGKQTPELVPSAFGNPALALPDNTVNVGSLNGPNTASNVVNPLGISRFDDVTQVAEAAKRDISNVANLERILLGLMDKPAIPVIGNNVQDQSGSISIPPMVSVDVNNVFDSLPVENKPTAVQPKNIEPTMPAKFGEIMLRGQTEGPRPGDVIPVVSPAFGEVMPPVQTVGQIPNTQTFDIDQADAIVPVVSSAFGDVLMPEQTQNQALRGQSELTRMMQHPADIPVSIFPLDSPSMNQMNPSAAHPVLSGSMGQPMFISFGTGNTDQGSSAAGPAITVIQGNQNAQSVNNLDHQEVRVQSMRNEHSVASVASAGVPDVFAREGQRQMSENDIFAEVPSTTPVPTTPLQTMSPERKAELAKVANMFLPARKN